MKRKTIVSKVGTLEELTTWLNEHKEILENDFGNVSCDLDYHKALNRWTLNIIA